MRVVYDAYSSLDAHVVKNLLESEGIEAYIQGEYLQGGVGELSAMNLVKVSVNDNDVARARAIIDEWDALQADPEPEHPYIQGDEKMQSGWAGLLIFAAGCLAGAAFTYQQYCI